jgi:hypothetical protein
VWILGTVLTISGYERRWFDSLQGVQTVSSRVVTEVPLKLRRF